MNRIQRLLLLAFVALLLGQANPLRADKETKDSKLAPPPSVTSFENHKVYSADDENITPPYVISAPDPPPLKDFSPAKVVLWCIVGTDGKAHMIKIAKHHNMEADMKAVENLKQWKFSVGVTRKDNQVVVVLMKVDVVWR